MENWKHTSKLLVIAAIIYTIIWGISFFWFKPGPIIHILLVIAVMSITLRIIRGKD